MRSRLIQLWEESVSALGARGLARRALGALGRPQPDPGGKLAVLALGKAAPEMVAGAVEALGERIRGGVCVGWAGGPAAPGNPVSPDGPPRDFPPSVKWLVGAHPLPDRRSEAAGRALLDGARSLGERDRALVLVSGGGSAMAVAPPPGVTVADLVGLVGALLRSGASIVEVNKVRRHLSLLGGGGLARAIHPARFLTLVLSDVTGDPIETVASGPTAPDPSTFADARAVLERQGLWGAAPIAARRWIESGLRGEAPESLDADDPIAKLGEHHLLAGPRQLLDEAVRRAEAIGFVVEARVRPADDPAPALADELVGWARRAAERPATRARLLVAVGEPSVERRGEGEGGRAQHLAALVALGLEGLDAAFLAAGSDGVDGSGGHAGALVDGASAARARDAGLPFADAIARFETARAHRAALTAIPARATGTNLTDLFLLAIGPPPI